MTHNGPHRFTVATFDPSFLRCSYIKCGAMTRVTKPALSVAGSATSEAAAQSIEPSRGRIQMLVYTALKFASNGLTAEELETVTGLSGNTIRPRLVELREENRIADSGTTRKTRANRDAVVWIAAT